MKKLFYFFAVSICAALMFAACKPTPKPIEEKTVNEIILSDYDKSQTFSDTVSFREVQIEYNGAIDTMDIEDLEIVDITCIAQTDDGVYFLQHDGLSQVEPNITFQKHDIWVGSDDINPYKQVKVTLEEALTLVKDSLDFIPNSRFVTLRIPVTAEFYENPFYIFGGATKGYVSVDAFTGELNTMK